MKTINPQLQTEQLQNLLRASKPAIITGLLLGLVLVFAEHNISNPKMIITWFILLLAVSLLRIGLLSSYQHNPDTALATLKRRLRNIRIGTFVSGIIWGSIGVLLFTTNDIQHLIFLLFILAGLTAGNTVSNASDLFSSIGFSVLALSPITLYLFLDGTDMFIYMGLELILYFGLLVIIGRYINANITQSSILQHKAEASEKETAKLLNNLRQAEKIAQIGNWHFDLSSNTLEWSDEIYTIFELDKERFNPTYEAFLNVIHPDERIKVANAYEQSLITKQKYEITHRLLMKDGRIKYVNEQCETKFDSDGKPLDSLGTVQDITQQMQNQIRLEHSENTLRYLLKMSPIAVRIAKNEGQEVIFANEAYAHLIHADIADVIGKNPKNYYADQEKYHEIVSQIKNNEIIYNQLVELSVNAKTIWVLASYMPIEFEGEHCVLGWFYDITKEKNLQTKLMEHSQQLEYIAHYDALTGLPNRILESDRLQQGIIQTQRRGDHLAVFYLDLDGFKHVNDSYGHAVGDQLLINLAVRMKQALREGDTLCRLGGDEFVAILADLNDVSDAMPIIHRLLDAASRPIQLGALVVQVSASIGVTFYPQEEEVNGDQLIRQADQAMYIAKQSGKNRYHIFDTQQ